MIVRDVITARGADTRTFLHSQLSNDIASLQAGSSCYSFVLEPTGKLSALVRVRCVADDHFVLDVDEGCGAATLVRLNKFKIRVKCEFESSTRHIVAIRGLDPAGRARALALPGAASAWREVDGAVDLFDDAVGERGIDGEVYHVERVRCRWPIFGVDVDTDTIPAETSIVDVCVSFTKGCYPGQELVERMDSRGSTAPRRLMRLPVRPSGNASDAVAGQQYLLDGVDIGRCTSVAGQFALVMVSRAHLGAVEALVRS